jgi:hypothetical protein
MVYFLLSVSLFSARSKGPLATTMMMATARWTTWSLRLSTCLNTLRSRRPHLAPPLPKSLPSHAVEQVSLIDPRLLKAGSL